VKIPTPVTDSPYGDDEPHAKTYIHKGKDATFAVSGGITIGHGNGDLDSFIDGIEKTTIAKSPEASIQREKLSGKGWTGEELLIEKNGQFFASVTIAQADNASVAYCLQSSLPYNSEETKQFIKSFSVDNVKVAKIYSNEHDNSPYNKGYFMGRYIVGPGLFCLAIFWVIRKIFGLAKKAGSKENQEKPDTQV